MIEMAQATMELRFKKSLPKVSLDIHAPPPRPQIFLQQKLLVQQYSTTEVDQATIPPHINVKDVVPPQLYQYTKIVNILEDDSKVIEVPKLVGGLIRWINVPAAQDNAPDEEPIRF